MFFFKLPLLNKNIYKNGINVIFLTEPPQITKTNALADVPGDVFNVFAEKYGRVAIITKGMTSWKCPQFCVKDIAVCQTKLNNCVTYLVSLCLDGKVHDFPDKFKDLFRKKGDCDIIIGTDSNSLSTVWNCQSSDKRGELIEQFIIDNDLTCLNVGNSPTFQNGAGNTSIIDLTIANYHLASQVSNWKVEQLLHSTDHYRLNYTIKYCPNFRTQMTKTWNFKKGDWSYFKNQLELGLKHWTCARIWSDVTIEQKLEQFTN